MEAKQTPNTANMGRILTTAALIALGMMVMTKCGGGGGGGGKGGREGRIERMQRDVVVREAMERWHRAPKK